MSYQGWTNYETWVVNLWMSNEEGVYNYWTGRAEELLGAYEIDGAPEDAVGALADEMRDTMEENVPEFPVSVYSDLLGHAIGMVDYFEIARAWIETAAENKVDA